MKRFFIVSLLITVLLSACGTTGLQADNVQEDQVVTIYKLPT
jgi:ABC-type Fe3+-hydroxamate transport system substrate-binding protein